MSESFSNFFFVSAANNNISICLLYIDQFNSLIYVYVFSFFFFWISEKPFFDNTTSVFQINTPTLVLFSEAHGLNTTKIEYLKYSKSQKQLFYSKCTRYISGPATLQTDIVGDFFFFNKQKFWMTKWTFENGFVGGLIHRMFRSSLSNHCSRTANLTANSSWDHLGGYRCAGMIK